MALRKHHSPLIKQGWTRAVLLFAVYLGLSVLAGYIIGVVAMPSATDPRATISPAYRLDDAAIQLWITVSFIISVSLVYLFRKYIDRRSTRSLGLGLRFTHFRPDAMVGFLLGLTLTGAGALIIYLTQSLLWTDIGFSATDLLINLVLMIMIAISEEFVFRGYILKNLAKSFNPWTALVISAVLFTLIHSGNPAVNAIALLNIFLAAVLMGIYYLFTNNLWFPVVFHFSWNFFQGPVLGFPVSGISAKNILTLETTGNPIITGAAFGLEGSLVSSFLLLLSITLLYYFRFKTAQIRLRH